MSRRRRGAHGHAWDWQYELTCAYEHLAAIDAGDPTQRGDDGRMQSRSKLGLACVKQARQALGRQRRQMTPTQVDNANARIGLVEGRLKFKPTKSRNGNGRRQVGLGLQLKQPHAKVAKVAKAPETMTIGGRPHVLHSSGHRSRGTARRSADGVRGDLERNVRKIGDTWAVYREASKNGTAKKAKARGRTRKFDGKSYRWDGATHTTKDSADTTAKRARADGYPARVTGKRGAYQVWVMALSPAQAQARRRAKVSGKASERRAARDVIREGSAQAANLGRERKKRTAKGPIVWIGWLKDRTKINVWKSAGGGYVCAKPGTTVANRMHFGTLSKLKARWPSATWHRAGSKAAKSPPRAPTTAKSQISVGSYERKATTKGYTRKRGRLPKRTAEGRFKRNGGRK